MVPVALIWKFLSGQVFSWLFWIWRQAQLQMLMISPRSELLYEVTERNYQDPWKSPLFPLLTPFRLSFPLSVLSSYCRLLFFLATFQSFHCFPPIHCLQPLHLAFCIVSFPSANQWSICFQLPVHWYWARGQWERVNLPLTDLLWPLICLLLAIVPNLLLRITFLPRRPLHQRRLVLAVP